MISEDVCRIETLTGLKLKIYNYDDKLYLNKDVPSSDNLDTSLFDPVILKNQLRYVSEKSWKCGVTDFTVTNLKYVSENELMLQIENYIWYKEIMKVERKSHFVYFGKSECWKRLENYSGVAEQIHLKYVAELI